MDFIMENLWLLVVLVAAISVTVAFVTGFIKLPTKAQEEKVKEWLLYAVSVAEKELGSGTGQIKLRFVYDMFLAKFTVLSKFIAFEQFSLLVDSALDKFEGMLESNKKLSTYIKGE